MAAVADAFSAMTADRSYRKALMKQQALDEIQKGNFSIDFTLPKRIMLFLAFSSALYARTIRLELFFAMEKNLS